MNKLLSSARLFIVTFLLALSGSVQANLILAEGGPTGQWYNPARNGEGFYIEIIEGSPKQIGVAMYSYDADGDPLWVVGNVAINADDEIVGIPVFEFNGPVWGAGYDPADLNTIPFGTITVRFPTCDTALFSVQPDGALQAGDYSLVRITSVVGVGCVEPPPEKPPSGPTFTPGRWSGAGVCFMVSEDGKNIFGGNLSECDLQTAFDSNLDGQTNEFEDCKVTASCEGIYPIDEYGNFTCFNELGELATGRIYPNGTAEGWAFEGEGGKGEYCAAYWSATPD